MICSFSFFVFCFSQQTIDKADMWVGTVLFCLVPLSEVWSFSKDLLINTLYISYLSNIPWRTSKTVITVRVFDKYTIVSQAFYYDYIRSTILKFMHFIPILWLKNWASKYQGTWAVGAKLMLRKRFTWPRSKY